MPRKIGILTWFRSTNPGAVLQAYSQAVSLQRRLPNYHVRLVDLSSNRRGAFRRIASEILGLRVRSLRERRHYSRAVARHLPVDPNPIPDLAIDQMISELDDRFDALVVGSDELWKTISSQSEDPFPNPFFLPGHMACKKIALAVSANTCSLSDIPDERITIATKLVSDFAFLGVRDDHTRMLLQKIGIPEGRIEKVPDPTFTFNPPLDRTSEVGRILRRHGILGRKPLVGVYGYFNSPTLLNHVRSVIRTLEGNGWDSVSLKYNQNTSEASLHGELDPFTWAATFEKLDLCITNTFHGTIFSIRAGTPVLAIEEGDYYSENKGKIANLLEDTDMRIAYYRFCETDPVQELLGRALAAKDEWNEKDTLKVMESMGDEYREKLEMVVDILNG